MKVDNASKKDYFSKKESLKKTSYLELAEKLLLDLSVRSREIISKRYGFTSGRVQTLEKIGQEYKITRERVRQIISEGLKNVSRKINHPDFLKAEEEIFLSIESSGGIIRESEIVLSLGSNDPREAGAIRFFVECSKKIFEAQEKGMIEKSLVISEEILKEAKKVISEAQQIIEKEKRLLEDHELEKRIGESFPGLDSRKALSYLHSSSRVKKNRFGKWGISNWTEISPKGTREKVHLILKHHRKPLHFAEIARLIDSFELGKRKAHPQTVHNELIKNDKFVLIGRGIYALREWGYNEGTIREVIQEILAKKGKPLDRENILEEVLKIRKVKPATVMINLNNRKYFEKTNGLYSLKAGK